MMPSVFYDIFCAFCDGSRTLTKHLFFILQFKAADTGTVYDISVFGHILPFVSISKIQSSFGDFYCTSIHYQLIEIRLIVSYTEPGKSWEGRIKIEFNLWTEKE